jgi:hypothetical protein
MAGILEALGIYGVRPSRTIAPPNPQKTRGEKNGKIPQNHSQIRGRFCESPC